MSPKKGFTLIELLVSVSISLLVLGFSVSGYRMFLDRRQADLATEELKSQLTLIRSKAANGERSTSCINLQKYKIKLLAEKKLQYWEVCDTAGAAKTLDNEQIVLLDSISVDDGDDGEFSFGALTGNLTDVTTNAVFCLTASSVYRQVTVSASGDINISIPVGCP